MLFDGVSDVDSIAITQLQIVYLENLVVFAVLEEVLRHKLDEHFTNICFHILAILWVEQHNLDVSFLSNVLSIAV